MDGRMPIAERLEAASILNSGLLGDQYIGLGAGWVGREFKDSDPILYDRLGAGAGEIDRSGAVQ